MLDLTFLHIALWLAGWFVCERWIRDTSIRLACDYRYLNSFTIEDAFPMPNLSEVMY